MLGNQVPHILVLLFRYELIDNNSRLPMALSLFRLTCGWLLLKSQFWIRLLLLASLVPRKYRVFMLCVDWHDRVSLKWVFKGNQRSRLSSRRCWRTVNLLGLLCQILFGRSLPSFRWAWMLWSLGSYFLVLHFPRWRFWRFLCSWFFFRLLFLFLFWNQMRNLALNVIA